MSGVWTDFKTESVEDQQKFILPLTRNTEKLFYNQRMIVDNKVLTEPRAWRISKINRINQNGTVLVTLYQDIFDQNKDYIELDEYGNVVGMWADYYLQPINPDPEDVSTIYSVITYSSKAQLKIGGSYKKFTVTFYDNEEEVGFEPGAWSYTIDGEDASSLISEIAGESDNQIKVKFIGDESYLDKQLVITYTSDSGVTSSVTVDIIAL